MQAHQMTQPQAATARKPGPLVQFVVPIANVAVDLWGLVIAWNAGAERLFGWTEPEVIGRRLPIVPETEWPGFASILDDAAHDRPIEEQAARQQRRDGSPIEVEMSVSPLRDARGRVNGVLALLTEAETGSDGGWTSATLTRSARMEAVGRLAGGVAHDFNNILTAIAGYAGLLATELPDDDPMQADVAEIRKATERATRLTRQLLAFGRRELSESSSLNLNEIVIDVLPMLRQLIGEHIELMTNTAAVLPPVHADPGQLEQVLINLLLNARDAMPHGGRLVVSTREIEADDAFVRANPGLRRGTFVRMTVEDTGTGIDADVLPHIFEPYFTTKDPAHGTGLGLSTVYGIVKANAGYIAAESESGQGTTISVYLPAH